MYDAQSDTWTDESVPWSASGGFSSACAHDGQIIVFTDCGRWPAGTALAQAADGLWYNYETKSCRSHDRHSISHGAVLLGETMRVEE